MEPLSATASSVPRQSRNSAPIQPSQHCTCCNIAQYLHQHSFDLPPAHIYLLQPPSRKLCTILHPFKIPFDARSRSMAYGRKQIAGNPSIFLYPHPTPPSPHRDESADRAIPIRTTPSTLMPPCADRALRGVATATMRLRPSASSTRWQTQTSFTSGSAHADLLRAPIHWRASVTRASHGPLKTHAPRLISASNQFTILVAIDAASRAIAQSGRPLLRDASMQVD